MDTDVHFHQKLSDTAYGQQASAEVWGRTGADSFPHDSSSYHRNPNGQQLAAAAGAFFPRDYSVDVFINKSARKALDTMQIEHRKRTVHG